MSDNVEKIKITSIKNPSNFFFYSLNEFSKLKSVKKQEDELQTLLKHQRSDYKPVVGNVCAFFHKTSSKWIRVKIDDVVTSRRTELAFFWCLDYGLSLSTDNFSRLSSIPKQFQDDHGHIQKGCLNLLPAALELDVQKCQMATKIQSDWSTKAVDLVKNCVKVAKELNLTTISVIENTVIGDIEIVNDRGEKFSVSKALIQANEAVSAEGQNESLKKLLKMSREVDQDDFVLQLPEIPKEVPCTNFEKIVKLLRSSMSQTEVAVIPGAENVSKNFVVSRIPPRNPPQVEIFKPSQTPSSLSLNPFKEIVSSLKPLIRNQDVYKIFVHGEDLHPPLESITEAHFPKEIYDKLHALNFRSIFRTQSHSWPHILEGRSTFIINEKGSGKTFSYLPAILSSILFEEEDSSLGPIAIIIVRSSREVETLYNDCLRLLPAKKIKIVKAFGNWNKEGNLVDLLNGCDLFITTPPSFLRLTQGDVFHTIDRKRIKHLVFDELDSMSEVFMTEIKEIVKKCTKGENFPEQNPQVIVTSTSWMPYIRYFMKLSCQPVVIMGSFAEAALYGKCQFSLTKNSFEEKLERLLKFLSSREWRKKKTLIAVKDMTEILYLKKLFVKENVDFAAIDKSEDDHEKVQKVWDDEPEGKRVYLVVDEDLSLRRLKSVKILIHFSMPAKFLTFSRRFATMTNLFLDVADGKTKERPMTIILLDDINFVEIPRLIEFLKTREVIKTIPEDIQKLVDSIVNEREQQKRDPSFAEIMPLCSNVLLFGFCPKFNNCKKRHAFIEEDKPVNIPCDGLVKFDVIGIRNAAHYSIKIREYLPLREKRWIKCEEKYKKIEETLSLMNEVMKNAAVCQVPVRIGDLCAVFDLKLAKWCRCKVLDKQTLDSNKPVKCLLLLIDEGSKTTAKSDNLMVLPEKFKLLDPLLTDLRIANLVPFDKDLSWDTETTAELVKYFSNKKNLGDYNICKVELAMQNTIFAETFEIRSKIDEGFIDVTKYTLKSDLLKRDFCLRDEKVVEKLKELAKRSGLYVPKAVQEVKVENNQKTVEKIIEVDVKWKKLSVGSEYDVKLKHFDDPNTFFVQIDNAGNKVLANLMKVVENCNQRFEMKEFKLKELCLIAVEGKKPQRGIIKEVEDDGKVTVFLVDFGEYTNCSKSEVFELPPTLVNAFPFQAVPCSFAGIKPRFNLKKWMPRPLRAFRDFLLSFCEGKLMKMKVVEVVGDEHKVLFFHPDSGERLDKVAVREKFADASDEPVEVETGDSIEEVDPRKNLLQILQSETSEVNFLDNKVIDQISAIPKKPTPKSKPLELQSSVSDDEKLKSKVLPSSLNFIHKHPKVEWRQSRIVLYINVAAADCSNYSLKLNATSMKIVIKYSNETVEAATIQFYGIIQPDLASHEKTGQNIIVRLVKDFCMMFDWPRLSKHTDADRFITFSEENVPTFSDNIESEGIRGILPAPVESDEEDAEEFEDVTNAEVPI